MCYVYVLKVSSSGSRCPSPTQPATSLQSPASSLPPPAMTTVPQDDNNIDNAIKQVLARQMLKKCTLLLGQKEEKEEEKEREKKELKKKLEWYWMHEMRLE